MDRAEATGLGVAVAGHLALLAALSLGLASVTRPMMQSDPIQVSFVDEVGLQAAVTEAQMEDPAEAMAPELGPMEEAAPTSTETPTPEPTPRSEERLVGRECVSTCSYRWSRYQ